MCRRLCLVLCAAVVLVVASERSAAAHGAGGIEATNFTTAVGGVEDATVVSSGDDEVEADSRDEPDVLGAGSRAEPSS